MDDERRYHVVVGVDGSPSAQAALRWAWWHARLVNGSVTAMTAWNSSTIYNYEVPSAEEYTTMLAAALSRAVADAVGNGTVEQLVVRGHPAWSLVNAALHADLLVLGSRGHGGFTSALLGSVAQHCVRHARCPVAVVRDHHS